MKTVNRYALKIASVLLVLCMLIGEMILFTNAATTDVAAWTASSASVDYEIKGKNTVVSERLYINGSFSGISLRIPTYRTTGASATVSVYAWNKDYHTTIGASALVSKNFTDLVNDATDRFDFGKTLPAGEYLVQIKNTTTAEASRLGIYIRNTRATSLGCMYDNYGIPMDSEMQLTVHFTESVATPFLRSVNYVKNTAPVYAYDYSCLSERNDDRVLAGNFGSIVSGYVGSGTKIPNDTIDPPATTVQPAPDAGKVAAGEALDHVENLINGGDDVMGQHVNVGGAISGFGMIVPTYGVKTSSVTLAAYKWDTDVYTSMKAAPIAAKRYTNLWDGNMLWLTFNESMPAGEYLFVVTEADGLAGVYRFRDNSVSLGYATVGNLQYPVDTQMVLLMEKGVTQPFKEVTTHKDTSTGTATVPQKWEAANDALVNTHKVQPSTWVFTDGLGRESLTYEDVGAIKSDKTLAMFFWDWHYSDGARQAPFNLQAFLEKYPEYPNVSNSTILNGIGSGVSGWTSDNLGTINGTYRFYWNEPIYGYYTSLDSWVLRRQAELIANAGVDVAFMDNSNHTWTWQEGYESVYSTWTDAQNDGVNVPKISYHLPMWQAQGKTEMQLELLYEDIYRTGKYENLWFWFDGKPMLIANGSYLDQTNNYHKEIASFFTLRTPLSAYNSAHQTVDGVTNNNYIAPENRIKYWDWSSIYPQPAFYANATDRVNGVVEQISVSVANNTNYKTKLLTAMNGEFVSGRSYTSTYQNRFAAVGDEATKWGYHFAEQFNYALSVDPKVIFVTSWNEWKVGMDATWNDVSPAFQDQFSDEYSRDIEPSKGALKDHYYYQLVNFSRKFQGAEPIPMPSYNKVIDLSADLQGQWADVEPYYAAYIGNTDDRNSRGWGSNVYSDYSGRNDIIGAQIARDDEFVYFNVECAENITSYTDKLWMNLYIDVDQENKGWETFDFVVNKTAASEKTSVLEKFTNGYTSEKVADVEYAVDGRYMTVKIAKSDLGLTGDDYTINFAWTDNVHDADDTGAVAGDKVVYSEFSGDIMDFYVSGDVAPGARFKFSYISTEENAVDPNATYTYINSISKDVISKADIHDSYATLTAEERVAFDAQANQFADADGFRAFDGTFELVSFDGTNYVYYTNHTYADGITVNGEKVDVNGSSVVVQTEYVKDGVPFYGWEDKNGNIVSNYATFKYYLSSKNDTLTAIYRSGDKLEVGVGVVLDRTPTALTVTVTPVRNKGNTVVEYGYFIGADKTFENYGTVSGNALDSIAGATKVTAKEFTSAYLQRVYDMSFNTFSKDISVMGYVTYTDAEGNTYTYYSSAKTAAPVHSEPSVDVVDPDVCPGGWI